MSEKFYKIELRQFNVKGLNARHYFWVLRDARTAGGRAPRPPWR